MKNEQIKKLNKYNKTSNNSKTNSNTFEYQEEIEETKTLKR